MANADKLIVCEDFYSIQGEGKSLGAPAVFLRLAGCNLRCPGFSYQHPETGEHLGCDTAHVWKNGEAESFEKIIARWKKNDYLQALSKGAHLVVSGGEPTIQQTALVRFFSLLDSIVVNPVFIELETNATLTFQADFLDRIDQINASPKLAHSGELKAYQKTVINQIASLQKTTFKFVVAQASDIDEILSRYVGPHHINPQRIWLMPEGGTKAAIEPRQQEVIELSKAHAMNYSTRLHLLVWDQATGV